MAASAAGSAGQPASLDGSADGSSDGSSDGSLDGALAGARRARRLDLVARLVIGLQLVLLLHGAWRVGPTYDEGFYAAAGYAYWQTGDFSLNREHPPLLKLLIGAPLVVLPDVEWSEHWRDEIAYPIAWFYQRNAEDIVRNLFLARLPMCLLTVFLSWVAWRAARHRFGARGGLACVLLLALNPNVLAHGRLAALDAGTAALLFVATVAFVDALERPSARRQLLAAVAFGLANLAKYTALLLGPMFVGLALLQVVRERSGRPLLGLARVLLGGLTVFAAGYGFETTSINEAWARAPYVERVEPEPVAPEAFADRLREELEAVGATEAWRLPSVVAVGRAANVEDAAWRWGRMLLDAKRPDPANAIVRSAEVLVPAHSGARKAAFELLLMRALTPEGGEPVVDLALANELLGRLADRTVRMPDGGPLPPDATGLARWEAWWAENRELDWDRTVFSQPVVAAATRGLLGDAQPIPLFTALKGLDYQLAHSHDGHGTYFMGKAYLPGEDFADGNPEPEYYAVVTAVKNPVAFLLAALLGLVLAFRFRERWGPLELVAFVGFPALCFWIFSTGTVLMGVRYVLPVFPFLALLAARAEVALPRVGIALGLVAALESLWVHPHQLMYYNSVVGGPDKGPLITVVGDSWGQGVKSLGEWYERNREEVDAAGGLHYAYYGGGDRAAFGLADAKPISGKVNGIVAIHAVTWFRERGTYWWMDTYKPFAMLDWSVYLFDTRVPPPGGRPDWR